MEIAIIIIIGLVIYIVVNNKKKPKQPGSITYVTPDETVEPVQDNKALPYKKKYLLTKNEWAFYKRLKPVADELGYSILAKIRVADLVEVTSNNRSEWQTYFNKINKKHIDFALAKPENFQIELLIELDDNSHNDKQKSRDEFIEALYKQTGYKLLRVNGSGDLKNKIESILNPEKPPIIQKQQNETAP